MKDLRSLLSPGSPCLPAIRTATDQSRHAGDHFIAKLVAQHLSTKLSVSGFPPPGPPHAFVPATRMGCVLCTSVVLFPSTRFLSAFHGHPHVPWWSFLVSAPSINWRRRTPAHQDGSHSESRNPRPASVETLPVPCLQTHAILATVFCRYFLFLMLNWISIQGSPAQHSEFLQ